MPRTQKQNRKIRHQTKQKILHSALNLMSRQGFNGTSISQIASHAGVSKGLIYNYFPSKDNILLEIFSDYTDQISKIIKDPQDIQDPYQELELFLDTVIKVFSQNNNLFRIYLAVLLQPGVSERLLQDNQAILKIQGEGYFDYLIGLMEKLGVSDPISELKWMKVIINGVHFNHLVNPSQFSIKMIKTIILNKYK